MICQEGAAHGRRAACRASAYSQLIVASRVNIVTASFQESGRSDRRGGSYVPYSQVREAIPFSFA